MEPEKMVLSKRNILFFYLFIFRWTIDFFWGNICLVFVHIVIISLLPKPSLLPSTVRSHPRCSTWDGTTPPLVIGVVFYSRGFFSIVFLSPKNIFSIRFFQRISPSLTFQYRYCIFFSKKFPPAFDSLTYVEFAGGCQHQYCSYRCRSRISSSWNALTATYWTSGLLEYSGATSRWRTLITRGVGLFVCLFVCLVGWLVGCLLVLFFVPAELLMDFFLVSGHYVVHTGMQRKGVSNGWLSAGWTLQNSNPCLPQLALS